MNRWAVIAAIVGAAFVTSCVPTSVMVRPETGLPTAAAPAATFWEALDTFDLERAKQLAADQAQQDLAFAIATAYEGNVDEAVAAARRSWPAMRDSESKRRARAQLEELLTSQSRWKEILDVYAQDPTPVEPTKDIRALALAYQNAPIERYQFAEGSQPFPIAINAAGMPVVEVEINGKKNRLVIDTGASITTISTDVARESGVVIGHDQGRAGTATTRTIAIRGAVIDRLRLGGLVITNHPAAVVESSVLRVRLLGLTVLKVDGVLGWNAIRRMTLRINFRDKTTTISSPVKQPITAPRNLFGIGKPIVELNDEDGQRLLFELDTGSTSSQLHEDALIKLGRAEARRKTMVLHGAGGTERYKSAVVPRLTLFTSGYALEFKNMRTFPRRNDTTVRRDGRLGSDIGKHGSITIDAMNGRFELLHEVPGARSR